MNRRKPFLPLVGLFVVVQSLINLFGARIKAAGVDKNVLAIGNLFVFFITLISLVVITKGMAEVKTMSFIRSVYISFIAKFFLVIAVVLVYALTVKTINTGALLASMGLYLVYTFLEVRALLTYMKRKPDGKEGSPD